MTLGMSGAQLQAMKQLDLWIVAISRKAHNDEPFLNSLLAEGGGHISAIISLTSFHMFPEDRGKVERLIRSEKNGDHASVEVLLKNNVAFYRRWVEALDEEARCIQTSGRARFCGMDGFSLSNLDAVQAMMFYFGKEKAIRLASMGFPKDAVRELLQQKDLLSRYNQFARLSDDDVTNNIYQLHVESSSDTLSNKRLEIYWDLFLLSALFHERGLNASQATEQHFLADLVKRGWTSQEAGLIYKMQSYRESYTPLDDNEVRFAIRNKYREVYIDLITKPPAQAFSQKNTDYLRNLKKVFFDENTGMLPLPADLASIRMETRNQIWEKSAPRGTFIARDENTPKGLKFCAPVAKGKTPDDPNIELIALIPKCPSNSDAASAALSVFEIVMAKKPN
jgi:hypothetical protein